MDGLFLICRGIMFVDRATIHLKAGNGGNGRVSFRREKYVPAGGPDGGDGGHGGSVIFVANANLRTLMDFRYKKKYAAAHGEDGGKKKKSGKAGEDLLVQLPVGTIIREESSGKVMADLNEDGQQVMIAKGGRGGQGNQHFATPKRRSPNFAKRGYPGEEFTVTLELKLLADVGLLGFPNVGKSTFLSIVSKANPKIANYHFTTLSPNLGVVQAVAGKSFVLADIPGLIEGASEGIGLGFHFLRHVERTKVLIHLVDISSQEGRNPVEDFDKINHEMIAYNPALKDKKQLVAACKFDLLSDKTCYEDFKQELESRGYEVFPLSSVSNHGVQEILLRTTALLDQVTLLDLFDEDDYYVRPEFQTEEKEIIYFMDDEVYCVEGDYVDQLLYSTDMDDIESLRRFQNALRQNGVFDTLRDMGIEDGDMVRIFDFEFEFFD